jgi:hypothetical protein
MPTLWPPHCEQRSRSYQSCAVVAAPYRSAISAGSGSTWWRQSRHHTMNRRCAAAAPPSVIGGPGSDFTRGGVFWLWLLAVGVHLRRRQRLANRWRLDLVEDAFQRSDTRRERIPIGVYGVGQQPRECGGFIIG